MKRVCESQKLPPQLTALQKIFVPSAISATLNSFSSFALMQKKQKIKAKQMLRCLAGQRHADTLPFHHQ